MTSPPLFLKYSISGFVRICFLVTIALLRYNSHILKFCPFKVYNSVLFSVSTELCNHHHYLILEHFHRPPKKPHTIQESITRTGPQL